MPTFFRELHDLLTYCIAHLFLLFFICLWVKWLIIAAISTRYKPYQLSGDPKILATEMERFAVVIPVLGEEPSLFREVLKRVLAERPGKLIVVINGPRDQGLESVCKKLNVDWVFTPRPGKRQAVKLGVDWIQKNFPENKYVALIDSDTLLTPGNLSELLIPFLADERVGGVCGTQRIYRPNRSLLARFADWMDDYYQANYWPAFSYLGQVHCLSGRCVVFRRKVIIEGMSNILEQRLLGVRIESADDWYLTMIALRMGYKTVFQSTSHVYTAAQGSLKKLVQQHLRWWRGDQACNLAYLRWLWRKKIPLAVTLTIELLVPFFLFAVFVNAFVNLVNGRSILPIFLGVAFLFFGLTHISRFRTCRRDILTLPVFIIMVAFLILPTKVWGLATCTFDRQWLTRNSSYPSSNSMQTRWLKICPLLLVIFLIVGSVILGYVTTT